MKRTHVLVACVLVLIVLTTASAAGQAELQGAWKFAEVAELGQNPSTHTPLAGVFMFTKKHYAALMVWGEEPRGEFPEHGNPTDAQIVAEWNRFTARAGTYEIKGTTLELYAAVTKDPKGMKAPRSNSTADFRIEGSTLWITLNPNTSNARVPLRFKLVRLE